MMTEKRSVPMGMRAQARLNLFMVVNIMYVRLACGHQISIQATCSYLCVCGGLWRRAASQLMDLHGNSLNSCRRNSSEISSSEGKALQTEKWISIPDTRARMDRENAQGTTPASGTAVCGGVMGSKFYHLWLGPFCFQLTSAVWSQETLLNLSMSGDVRIVKPLQTGKSCHLCGGSI
jgi:hypothetical protein